MKPAEGARTEVSTIEVDGARVLVTLQISYDGVEYIGRLWFAENSRHGLGHPDRGQLAGRTKDEVIALALALSEQELTARYKRAMATKRRYLALRRVTDEILNKIRYLNRIAISMRAGLIDMEGAAQEIDLTEQQLHGLIRQLRDVAGVEDPAVP
jgi:hypothetical protein